MNAYALSLQERKQALYTLLSTGKSDVIFGDTVDDFLHEYQTYLSFDKRVSKELMEYIKYTSPTLRSCTSLNVPSNLVDELRNYCGDISENKAFIHKFSRELLLVFDVVDVVKVLNDFIYVFNKDSPNSYIPIIILVPAVFKDVFVDNRTWILEWLLSCVADNDLYSLLHLTTPAVSVANSIINRNLPLPDNVQGRPFLNWYIEQGGTLDVVRKLHETHSINVDLPLLFYDRTCSRFSVDLNVFAWVLKHHQGIYPFDFDFDDIAFTNLSNSSQDSTCLVALLVFYNCLKLTSYSISALLQWVNFDSSRFVKEQCIMMFNIHKAFSTRELIFDLRGWVPYVLGPPSDTSFKFLLSCLDPNVAPRVANYIVQNNQCYCINMNYWALELHRLGYLDGVSKLHLQRLDVDTRILDFLFPKRLEHKDEVNVNYLLNSTLTTLKIGKVAMAVHLKPLLDHSILLKVLTENRGFKKLPGLEEGVLELSEGFPEGLLDQETAIRDWVLYCYLHKLPNMTVERVRDLASVASYLADDQCLGYINEWVQRKFLEDFKHHTLEDHDRGNCVICMSWNECASEPLYVFFTTPFADFLVDR